LIVVQRSELDCLGTTKCQFKPPIRFVAGVSGIYRGYAAWIVTNVEPWCRASVGILCPYH